MFALLLACLVTACAAAPQYHHGPPPFHPQSEFDPGFAHHNHHGHYDPFESDIFDTRQFWSEMANELRQLDVMLSQFHDKFPTTSSTQGVEGNHYKVTIPLKGFEEKDIVVKAREGLLMVQAVHKLDGGIVGERSFLDIKTLPSTVNVTGSWTFEENVLKIVFPMKTDANTENVDVSVTETLVTEAPVMEEHSREVMDTEHNNADGDADIEAGRGDQQTELLTNEIPRNTVEATTYAVDLKDEVEFVPVRFR